MMFNQFFPLLLNSDELKNPATGEPFSQLPEPVSESTFGRNDHKGPIYILVLLQESNQGNSLNCFTQAHFVSQDPVYPDFVQGNQPV